MLEQNKKDKQQTFSSITYRNAIYEGNIDVSYQTRYDFGIIYLAKSHQFVCCSNWHNDRLQGECLFYNDHKKYAYGQWINDLPQGFNVFRIQQTIFMTYFNRGRINKNQKILIILQKYNLGVILTVTNHAQTLQQLKFQMYTKKPVYSSQDVHQLYSLCKWQQNDFLQNQTLIKYLSTKFVHNRSIFNNSRFHKQKTNNNHPVKLRLIQNKYYRFGYDQGLAVIFDQDFNRISVGYHVKSKLTSFGIVYKNDQKQNKIEQQGVFDNASKLFQRTYNSATKNNGQNRQTGKTQDRQLGKIYKTNLLMGVNFSNKFYKNPSSIFFYHIDNIFHQTIIRDLITELLTTRRLIDEETLNFSKIDPDNQDQSNYEQSESILNHNQLLRIQPIVNQRNNKTQQQQNNYQKKNNNQVQQKAFNKSTSQKSISQKTTQLVNDRLRLQQIKKQIYSSIQRRNRYTQQNRIRQQFQRTLINKQLVGNNNNFLGKKNQYDESNYFTPQKTINKSKSRKKIFEQSQKNIKLLKELTPSKSQADLTPFKTKMKNRIFNKQTVSGMRQYIKDQKQRSKSKTIYKKDHNREDSFQDNSYYDNREQINKSNRFDSQKRDGNRTVTVSGPIKKTQYPHTEYEEQKRQNYLNYNKNRQKSINNNKSPNKHSSIQSRNNKQIRINNNQVMVYANQSRSNHNQSRNKQDGVYNNIGNVNDQSMKKTQGRRQLAQKNNDQIRHKQSLQQYRQNKSYKYVPIDPSEQIMRKKYTNSNVSNNNQQQNSRTRNQINNLRLKQLNRSASYSYDYQNSKNHNSYDHQNNNNSNNQNRHRDSVQNKNPSLINYSNSKIKPRRQPYNQAQTQTYNDKQQQKQLPHLSTSHHKRSLNQHQQTTFNPQQGTLNDRQKEPIHQQESNQKIKQYQQQQRTNHRVTFRNSNQVYLVSSIQEQQQQRNSYNNNKRQVNQQSFSNNNELNRTSNNKRSHYQYSYVSDIQNKNSNKTTAKRQISSSSYMKKHNIKKSIQKQIQRSPDRHRCYGKNANKPYLESPQKISNNRYQRRQYQNSNQNKRSSYVNDEKRNRLF